LVKTESGFSIVESVTNRGHKAVPKEISEIPYQPYSYYEQDIPSREDLFWKVRDEFDHFLDVESIYKDFLAACVLLSYQQEKVRTAPYVYFYGDNESGKTVALTLLSLLCYRPMFGVTIPAADLYGYLDDADAPGTILEDEIQGLNRDLDKSKIYKAGYKQGATIPRTFFNEHKRFIKYFRCFCFKAAAAEEMPRVKGLLERFIFIQMVEGFPKKDWADYNKEDEQRIQQLRNMLLKWRLATRLEWFLPEVELPVKGRLKELWMPIIQIVSGLPVEPDLRQFLDQLQKERMNEKVNTLEGRLVKVVSELYTKDEPLPFPRIWDALVRELGGKLDDRKPHQMDTSEFLTVTKSKIGYRLREVLGGKSRNMRYGEGVTKGYEFVENKLRRVAKKYGCNIVAKLPSELSSEGVSKLETMEKDHESSMPKQAPTPQEVGKLSYSATTLKPLPNTGVTLPLSDVVGVIALDPVSQGQCPLCKKRDVSLVWQVQLVDGSRYDAVCMDCGGRLQEELRKRGEVK